jgi:hypothetical protein
MNHHASTSLSKTIVFNEFYTIIVINTGKEPVPVQSLSYFGAAYSNPPML